MNELIILWFFVNALVFGGSLKYEPIEYYAKSEIVDGWEYHGEYVDNTKILISPTKTINQQKGILLHEICHQYQVQKYVASVVELEYNDDYHGATFKECAARILKHFNIGDYLNV